MKLTKNFSLNEFVSTKDKDKNNIYVVLSSIKELAHNLQVLRDHLGKPIRINSGFRSKWYNDEYLPSKGVRTARKSQHKKGQAADIRVGGMTSKELHNTIAVLMRQGKMKKGGLGLYNTFVHYDIRGYLRWW